MTNVRRMSALIDDTLDFAPRSAGLGIGVQIAEVDDLERALLAVASELQDSNPGRSIDCSVSIGRTIRCDRGRIQQLASNLLSNALRHGSSSHPVYFSAHIDDTDLVIQVANRGTPIPPESLARIFEPFWRHSISASREGLGLGLLRANRPRLRRPPRRRIDGGFRHALHRANSAARHARCGLIARTMAHGNSERKRNGMTFASSGGRNARTGGR